MKKLFLLFLFVIQTAFIFATGNEVSMVSYEQNWLDLEGTIALKNNTDKEVKRVTFIITYLDMEGNQLDYREFDEPVNIKPGMTKKINIEPYERDRHYSYYKSEAASVNPHKFNIEYKLLSTYSNDYSNEQKETGYYANGVSLALMFIMLFVVTAYIGLFAVIAAMAKKRNRSALAWVALSLFINPIITIIVLAIVGEATDNRERY